MVPDTASRLPLIETNKPKQKKQNWSGVCAADLQSSNQTNTENRTPVKVRHLGGLLGDWWKPGSVRSPRSSTQFVKEENFVFFKVDLGLFKKKKKGNKTWVNGVKW